MATSFTGIASAMKPIRSKSLFDAKGMNYEQWKGWAPAGANMPSIAPTQVDDSVANKVNSLTSQDSALMQAAKTEGLKAANRRGLLNSSMAAGAAMDAMTRYALPIAQQDASQDFNRNAAARQFEYGMAAQDAAQDSQAGERALDRRLDREMQANQISLADRQQIRDTAFRLNLFDRDASLQRDMQQRQFSQQTGQAALDRALQEKLSKWDLDNAERNAAAQFLSNMEQMYVSQYQSILANTNLDSDTRTQFMQSIKNLRDTQLNLVEQMFQVDLSW